MFFLLALLHTSMAMPVVFVPVRPLQPHKVEQPDEPDVASIVSALDARVSPGEEAALELRWTLTALKPGWVDLPLLDGAVAITRATLDGKSVALQPDVAGMQHLVLWLDGRHSLVVTGTAEAPGSAINLAVLGGARQQITVLGPFDAECEGAVKLGAARSGVARFVGGDREHLALSWRPAGPPADKPPLLRAEAATALTLDSGGLLASSVLRYRVARGSFETVQLRLPDVESLEITGDGVVGFDRQGDIVTVNLSRPVTDHLEIRLSYRGNVGGDLPMPWPLGGEVQGWASLLRADDSLVAPSADSGAEVVSGSDLPEWARGLADGSPIASYKLSGAAPALSARVVIWDPIEGPPTVIDEARYELATTAHGRTLLRVRYQVRNDRNQFLRMTVPADLQLIGVVVAGRAAQAAADEDGTLLIPLEKSVETLSGLVTFPVDVAFWGKEEAWAPRGERKISTPAVNAPIAYARWELILPPDYDATDIESNATEVPSWSSREGGLQYGHSYGQGLEEDKPRPVEEYEDSPVDFALDGKDVADETSQNYWNEAYNAYKENRFEDARGLLDQSLAYNPSNSAAQALVGNLDVLSGKAELDGEQEAAARRVKDMAKARTGDIELRQAELQQKADEAVRAGDYAEAEKTLEDLVSVSSVLASVEQTESVDKKQILASSSAQLATVRSSASTSYSSKSASGSRPSSRSPASRPKPQAAPVESPAPETQGIAGLIGVKGGEAGGLGGRDRGRADAKIPRGLIEAADTDGDGIADDYGSADEEYLDDIDDDLQGLPPRVFPVREGYATIISEDPQALFEAENGLVLDPDIAALLEATDVTGFTGNENLDVEVVYMSMGFGGMGAAGYGSGGSGYGSGAGAVGTRVTASPLIVPIPRGGKVLRFEARLLSPGEPLTANLETKQLRNRDHKR